MRNPGLLPGPGRKYNFGDYRYGFSIPVWGEGALNWNLENDSDGEFSSLTHYDYGFRIYNPAIGRFLSVDPLASKYAAISPYVYVLDNPLIHTDPDGMSVDGEYERDANGEWVKVSDVGDEIGVDFYHEDIMGPKGTQQVTRIEDEFGNTNFVTGGRDILKEGVLRNADVDWANIYAEWRGGTGPEKSIFEGNHPANLDIQKLGGLRKELEKFSNSSDVKKGPVPYEAGNTGFPSVLKGDNIAMQTLMMGRFNMNFYKLGDRTLVLALDSKSRQSAMGHTVLTPDYSRSEGMPYPAPMIEFFRTKEMTTTYQSYLFFMD